MKILVTGATGKLGLKVAASLLESVPASDLAVSVRNPVKAEELRASGVEVRQGDFDRPETLDKAFAGIDRLLIISTDGDNETRIQQHKNAVQAAERAGIGFIAYTSLANATESKNSMAPPHVATEAAIVETGIPYSFLRNNWYLENEIGSIQGAMAGAPWVTSAGEGKVGWALQQDYADAAAEVLVGDGHENTIYELSGPLLTQEELAAAVGNILGKEVPVQQVSDEEYAEVMKGLGLPDYVLPIVVGIQQSIRNGSLEVSNTDFEKVLGRPVTPINEALEQIIKANS
ncbi:SDR family oxidoreductase [Planococcus halotolerans]|uniref:SDR family NAD(P)-dependent oxidoreductase n=1 Tax=Planococcus halotolerans TaxID=2233542 RepID=A0A365KX57_9BACL|nr:SDR family oxidoreductase [Planococcus halotolerans]QHJ72215.1 NmrA family NAD(P)-binding protein [Planococcus halotolerans]RAZ77768.1 SDR family NAD(P)-dependent oxidoreductase [Planococcus halotolerans]